MQLIELIGVTKHKKKYHPEFRGLFYAKSPNYNPLLLPGDIISILLMCQEAIAVGISVGARAALDQH